MMICELVDYGMYAVVGGIGVMLGALSMLLCLFLSLGFTQDKSEG